jgi:hypothetical protein
MARGIKVLVASFPSCREGSVAGTTLKVIDHDEIRVSMFDVRLTLSIPRLLFD